MRLQSVRIRNFKANLPYLIPSNSTGLVSFHPKGQPHEQSQKNTIEVQGTAITILSQRDEDYISLTDMAKKFGDDSLIYSWMRNRNTLEYIGIWERIHNPGFKGGEFETFKTQAGLNSFHLTPRKWIEATAAIGFQSRAGRHGGGT